jgi:GT2 family glycosyltransferase
MFSEEYFMYGEDIDLNWKVRALGLANYYIEDAEIVHHGGKSSSRQMVSQWSTTMMYTAMLSYYRKNRSPFYAAMYKLAMGASALLRLGILMVMYPFVDREMYLAASAKWRVVLQWAMGHSNLAASQKETGTTSAKTKAEVRA